MDIQMPLGFGVASGLFLVLNGMEIPQYLGFHSAKAVCLVAQGPRRNAVRLEDRNCTAVLAIAQEVWEAERRLISVRTILHGHLPSR